MAGALDRNCQRPLVLRAGARLTTRLDLRAIGDHPPQPWQILVVNFVNLVHAELADLTALEIATATTATTEAAGAATGAIVATRALATITATRPAGRSIMAARPAGRRIVWLGPLFVNHAVMLLRMVAGSQVTGHLRRGSVHQQPPC
jgi:hypothetical protein